MSTTYQAPMPSRPLGVAILAVLIGIYGFLVFLVGLLIAVGSGILSSLGSASPFHVLGVTGVLAGIIILVIGLIILGLAVGLWHLRMWALVLTILFLLFEIVVYGIAGAYLTLGFIIAILLLIYLVAVSRHFT
ncbi:MAG TPA: hypothetical protein VMC82_04800 [Thermoplasmata archaeon]|nr:hypothetical protein [Thermoplasmata archaeon]